MSDEPNRREQILLAEYLEAGSITRQHESLSRTTAAFFITILLAITGYVFREGNHDSFGQGMMCLVAAALAALASHMMLRHQAYYGSYLRRAKDIEEELQGEDGRPIMKLYTDAKGRQNRTDFSISNKDALFIIFFIGAFVFLSLAISFFQFAK